MNSRAAIFLSAFACGALGLAALWQLVTQPPGQPTSVLWSTLAVTGSLGVFLVWSGVKLNARQRAKQRRALEKIAGGE
ncbi:MAG: hypothetical protein JO295_00730 [Verrucomicrobia bacterium]|nr:hypothetical protein [Verrucomicrobiota bacterium]